MKPFFFTCRLFSNTLWYIFVIVTLSLVINLNLTVPKSFNWTKNATNFYTRSWNLIRFISNNMICGWFDTLHSWVVFTLPTISSMSRWSFRFVRSNDRYNSNGLNTKFYQWTTVECIFRTWKNWNKSRRSTVRRVVSFGCCWSLTCSLLDAIEKSKNRKFIFPHSVYWHENLRTSDVYDAQDHNKKTALDYIASYLLTHFSVVVSVAWAVLLLAGWLAAVALASCTRFVSFTTFFLLLFRLRLSSACYILFGFCFGWFVRCALSSAHSFTSTLVFFGISFARVPQWFKLIAEQRKIHHCALLDAVHAETTPNHWKCMKNKYKKTQYDLMLCT